MEERQKYFEQALSNMVHDAASGGAIRHLVDSGYSVNQIMERLDYPTPKSRVEDTVYQYMIEQGILLETLSVEESQLQRIVLRTDSRKEISGAIRERLIENGEEVYVRCLCKKWCGILEHYDDRSATINALHEEKNIFCDLTSRERDYLLGIPWRGEVMYHRLTDRMLEIAIELAYQGEEMRFYFLKSMEMICNI